MERLLTGLLGFLLVTSVGSHAARAPEQYWKSALPNTPMPSSLSQLLNTPAGGTTVNVGWGGVHVDAGHGKPGGTTVDVGKGGVGVNVNPGSGKPGGTTVGVGKGGVGVNVKPGYGKPGGTTVGVGKGGVGVNVNPGSGKPGGTTVGVGKGSVGVNVNPGSRKPGGTTVGVGKGGVGVNVNPGSGKPGGTTVGVGKGGVGVNVNPGYGKPGGTGTTVGVGKGGVGVNVQPGYGKPGGTTVGVGKGGVGVHVNPRNNVPTGPFGYSYAATETQLHDDPNVALFFQEKDLHPGKKMILQFTNTTAGAKFLPRSEAETIPFSSEKASEILGHFSVNPDSVEAAEMTQTLHDCETPAAKGEKKACATSLESMVDFATSSLATSHVRAVSTVVAKEGSPRQEYTMTGVKRAAGTDGRLVACHAEPYAYAVFACHLTQQTRAYSVSMLGKDGTAVEAVAVCHADTSGWNPKHVAFQVLKVKPGTVPVCHFLPQDHVVWTRSG
ncbi:BURP domain-containing protein 3-like [Phragmites australis]|uniref:BURP domain-containing protein 3-like n=1 Tax=Phragmites australis TaxID=29695 RepID=UPI002D775963|nr:BURP domain-containing protein 3-like [Phragmites australis]